MLNVELLDEDTFNYIASHVELVGKEKDYHVFHLNYRKLTIPNDFESFTLKSGKENVIYMTGNKMFVPIHASFLGSPIDMKVGDESNYFFHVRDGEVYCRKFNDDYKEDIGLGVGVWVNYDTTIKRTEKGMGDFKPIMLPKINIETVNF